MFTNPVELENFHNNVNMSKLQTKVPPHVFNGSTIDCVILCMALYDSGALYVQSCHRPVLGALPSVPMCQHVNQL